MPRLTAASIAKRRLHIVESAMRCFRAKGFILASVDDICAEGRISKGAFYSQFASKEELVHSVAELLAGTPKPLDSSSVAALAESIAERRSIEALRNTNRTFAFEIIANSFSDPVLRARLIAYLEAVKADVANAVADLVAAGLARPGCDPETTASIIQSCLLGGFTASAVWETDKPEEYSQEIKLLVESLIAPRF
jgi:AcrR family transcriptional regulator